MMTDRECIDALRSLAMDAQDSYEKEMISRKLPRTEQRVKLLRIQGQMKALAYAIGRLDQLDEMQGD